MHFKCFSSEPLNYTIGLRHPQWKANWWKRSMIFDILISSCSSVTSYLPSQFHFQRLAVARTERFPQRARGDCLRSKTNACRNCSEGFFLKPLHQKSLSETFSYTSTDDFAVAKRAETCNGNHGNSPVSQQCM